MVAVLALLVVVVVETVVLTVMASLLSFVAAIVVPAAVLGSAAYVIRDVRWRWTPREEQLSSWEELVS